MHSDGGMGGALFLAQMMELDRDIDAREAGKREMQRRLEEGNRAVLQDSLSQRYELLDAAYEALRKKYNALAAEANQQDATIADLQRARADLERQAEQQRLKLEDVTTELALLRSIDERQNPDRYGYR